MENLSKMELRMSERIDLKILKVEDLCFVCSGVGRCLIYGDKQFEEFY